MYKSFWDKKWQHNEIAFHENETNPMLVKYFNKLSLTIGIRIFIPLCGKTLDIHWFLSNGYRVAGVELSKIAIEQLFTDLKMEPKITKADKLDHYSAMNIDIFAGNILDLSSEQLGSVDAVYDRAALVALPEAMRYQYTTHLITITDHAPQLLICYEYDQRLIDGPPFSIGSETVYQHYKSSYDLTLLASENIPGGMKGKCAAKENVWLLKND